MPKPRIFLDFEASGLSKSASYPIEVAYVDRFDERRWRCLIAPAKEWTYWDARSEKIHGISRSECVQYGADVIPVAKRLNADLAREVVLVDAIEYDSFWLQRLFQAAGISPSFSLASVYDFISDPDALRRLQSATSAKTHRALADVVELRDHINEIECAEFFSAALEICGDKEATHAWLRCSVSSLGTSPLQLALEGKSNLVLAHIERIKQGGYA